MHLCFCCIKRKLFWLGLFQSIGITKPRSQMTGITLRLTHFCLSQMQTHTHGHNTPLNFAGDGLGWALSSTWQCTLTLHHSEHCTLRANPNKGWAQRVDYLWNKAIWGKPLKGSINMGTVSSYVDDLKQIDFTLLHNLCHGQGGVSWCFSGKNPKPTTTSLRRKRNTYCSFDT